MAKNPDAEKVAHIRQWVANRAKELRKRAGFTQTQVARKMNIGCHRVSDFERNENDFKATTIFRYCSAVGISVEKFFEGCPDV